MSVSISASNRTSISNVNLSKIPPLHKILDDRNLGSKRLSEQIKFNKENQLMCKKIIPKSSRLSAAPVSCS